ncbi:hypothetical protein EJB05_49724 [Eragrostis curvula]|uniref:Response regulatory domain-containing protein n=1 Tax=Eragrostis curvula TaxID=38414 RepID=A0A5J9T518_9POAL|nr:hypothetical protein EJB05_49724 [Eragrostis curvula]
MSTSQVGNASTKASPHVLVVDDANVDRFIASKLLQRSNIRVTVVDGPKQALKVLDEESPKLKHLPVVIMSAESIPSRIKECMDGGAKEYIVKPIRATDIARILSYI